jgi:hypothetical protein
MSFQNTRLLGLTRLDIKFSLKYTDALFYRITQSIKEIKNILAEKLDKTEYQQRNQDMMAEDVRIQYFDRLKETLLNTVKVLAKTIA